MMLERKKLEEFAREAGADLVGAANIGRFDELPREKNPKVIFPEVKTVVIIGRRIPRGALRGVEEGTQFSNYQLFGSTWLEDRFLPMATFSTAEFIEDNGWEAVPLQNLPPEIPPMGVSVRKGLPEPNVMLDLDDAAVRAGLGEIGYCRQFLTPRFGPRQRFQMILTDAEIEPDGLPDAEICPRGECTGFCPLGAFSGEEVISICGKKMTVGKIDYNICSKCKNGAAPNRHHPSGKPDRMAAVCTRSCVNFLENKGLVSNKFEGPFRRRDAWARKTDETDFYSL